ncbi:toll/interleukin-1 receptor domain-containing protein [Deinococcus sp. UYEF24]
MTAEPISPDLQFIEVYRARVTAVHPDKVATWPLLSGNSVQAGVIDGFLVMVFHDSKNSMMRTADVLRQQTLPNVGIEFQKNGMNGVRKYVAAQLRLTQFDFVYVSPALGTLESFRWKEADLPAEAQIALEQHETALGLTKNKIFLSRQGVDKAVVQKFKSTLDLLGFSTWLDEDAQPAGAALEPDVLNGFADSCAVVFFVASSLLDQGYLASEIEYAIAQKQSRQDQFQIITLVMDHDGQPENVSPALLNYVYKKPASHLEAMDEILKALPVQVGQVTWK